MRRVRDAAIAVNDFAVLLVISFVIVVGLLFLGAVGVAGWIVDRIDRLAQRTVGS